MTSLSRIELGFKLFQSRHYFNIVLLSGYFMILLYYSGHSAMDLHPNKVSTRHLKFFFLPNCRDTLQIPCDITYKQQLTYRTYIR